MHTRTFRFDLFHRYPERFDRPILDQLQVGEHSLPVPFAQAAIDLLIGCSKQIYRTPGIDYAWPGNVRELEQCVGRILLKHTYTPLAPASPLGLTAALQRGIATQSLDVKSLVGGYCRMLHQQHKTIEAVARITGLDRRTAKKTHQGGQTAVCSARRLKNGRRTGQGDHAGHGHAFEKRTRPGGAHPFSV